MRSTYLHHRAGGVAVMKINFLGLLVLAVALAGCGGGGYSTKQVMGCTSSSPTTVCTQQGQLQGTVENGLLAFRGIPFAAPPVGDLRWRPPVAPVAWQGVRSAASFGQPCPQTDFNTPPAPTGSEDCLTLNIYSANPTPNPKQPVMVFFHGGGEVLGNSGTPPYRDAPPLAGRGVVVVTAQYRLGLMGFFAHPKLTTEGGGASGNYALMDMIAALQWVHDNIASFGGDPGRVMMFGESSGSVNVQFLLLAPPAQGLFARAGMESGAIGAPVVSDLSAAYAQYAQLSPLLGCNTASDELACLRAASASAIITEQLNSGQFPNIFPNLEPIVLPVDPFNALMANGSPVPLLIGSNSEEAAASGEDDMVPPLDEPTYESEIHAQFDPLLPGSGTTILGFYPSTNPYYDNNPRYAHVDVETDWDFTEWTRDVARVAAGPNPAGPNKVWRYLYTHRYDAATSPFLNSMRAFHGAELFFVFGNLSKIYYNETPYTPTPAEVTLSNQIMDYWTRFAATGDPNGAGATPWLPYDANDNIFQLDENMTTIIGYHNPQCDFMDTFPIVPVAAALRPRVKVNSRNPAIAGQ